MKESSMQPCALSLMPVNETAINLHDDMLVMDSLECPMSSAGQDMGERFPMKLPMSCMMIVVRGEVRYSINFREFVATGNSCALISEGTIIDNVSFGGDARVIQLMFSKHVETVSQPNGHCLYTLQGEQLTMLNNLYGMLRMILVNPAFSSNRADAAACCVRLMRSIISQDAGHNAAKKKSNRREEIVARFLDCVNEHYREHRELGFYADQLSLSLKYMSQVIYDQTGRHPSQWIKDYVILDAKTMLRSGQFTVQQVAEQLHFPNQSFFGKYFKEAVGVSPKKWK